MTHEFQDQTEEITGCALSPKCPRGIKDASLGVLLPAQFFWEWSQKKCEQYWGYRSWRSFSIPRVHNWEIVLILQCKWLALWVGNKTFRQGLWEWESVSECVCVAVLTPFLYWPGCRTFQTISQFLAIRWLHFKRSWDNVARSHLNSSAAMACQCASYGQQGRNYKNLFGLHRKWQYREGGGISMPVFPTSQGCIPCPRCWER